MKKLGLSLLLVIFVPLVCFSQESVTITTYYPSPSGAYKKLTSNYLKFTPQSTSPAQEAVTLYWDNGPGQGGVAGFYYWDGVGWNLLAGAGGGGLWTESEGDIYREDGNVGIGTTDPQATLDVNGIIRIKDYIINDYLVGQPLSIRANGSLSLSFDDNNDSSDQNFYIYKDGVASEANTVMSIEETGNVGIGTTTPASRLEVNGVVTATDFGCTGCLGVPEISQTAFQRRVGGAGCPGTCSCPLEQSIRVINEDGTVICEPDSISAGGGVSQIVAGSNVTISPVGGTGAVTINSSGGGGGGVDGSGTANKVSKWTDSDTLSDSQIYDDGTSVGIGIASPGLKLHVAGNQGAPATSGITQNGHARLGSANSAIVLDMGTLTSPVLGAWLQTTNRTDLSAEYKLLLNPNGGNVGIGITDPGAKLEVAGQVKITGGSPGLGRVLTSDASGLASWQTPSSGIGGSGTANYIPKFTGDSAIGNSVIYESSGKVGIGTTTLNYLLNVNGEISFGINGVGRLYTDGSKVGIISAGTRWVQLMPGGSASLTAFNGGNVGIGTTTAPAHRLEVVETDGWNKAALMLTHNSGTTQQQGILRMVSSRPGNPNDYFIRAYRSGGTTEVFNLNQQGKGYFAGGIDPPYVSYTNESHESIKEYAKKVEEHEKVMLFWNGKTHRMEVYVIEEDKFYTITGELVE